MQASVPILGVTTGCAAVKVVRVSTKSNLPWASSSSPNWISSRKNFCTASASFRSGSCTTVTVSSHSWFVTFVWSSLQLYSRVSISLKLSFNVVGVSFKQKHVQLRARVCKCEVVQACRDCSPLPGLPCLWQPSAFFSLWQEQDKLLMLLQPSKHVHLGFNKKVVLDRSCYTHL